MEHWKLGCRWRTGKPLFYNYLKEKSFVVGVWDKEYEEGDLILLTDGFSGLGIAKVTGPASSAQDYPELREEFEKLQIDFEDYMLIAPARIFDLPSFGALFYQARQGICRINDDDKPTLISAMNRYNTEFERMEQIDKTADLLKAKGQIILQGPPGTGKTWLAERVAEKLAAAEDVKLVQFHPAYAYEDFVRGIIAQTDDGGRLSYGPKNKVLAEFAAKAAKSPNRSFVLIIDEINRANLPSVLGELIYALEYRGKRVESIYGDEETGDLGLLLPKNLLVIGTMNTSDRSVGHLDYAIRRRFAFVSVLPDVSVVSDEAGKRLFDSVAALFEKEFLAPEFERDQVQPGHSYFMTKTDDGLTLTQKLDYEIRPLLQEYLRDGVLRPNAKEAVGALRA